MGNGWYALPNIVGSIPQMLKNNLGYVCSVRVDIDLTRSVLKIGTSCFEMPTRAFYHFLLHTADSSEPPPMVKIPISKTGGSGEAYLEKRQAGERKNAC